MTRSRVTIITLLIIFAGIFGAGLFEFNRPILVIKFILGIILLLTLTLLIWRNNRLIKLSAWFLIVLWSGFGYYHWFLANKRPSQIYFDQKVELKGWISSPPEFLSDHIRIIIKAEESKPPLSPISILVEVPRWPEYQYGQQLKIIGFIKKPTKIEQFDYPRYLEYFGIYGIVKNPEKIEVIGQVKGHRVVKILYFLKGKFLKVINQSLPEPSSSYLQGILLGTKKNLPESLSQALQNTGTTHLVVISGYNVTILINIFRHLTFFSPILNFYFGLMGILVLILMTGASSSVVRAGIMGAILLLAKKVGRKDYPIIAILLAGAMMLLVNPLALRFDLGFQLSFAAVLGLIYLSPIIELRLAQYKWGSLIGRPFREGLASTAAAQIFTLPILIGSFGRISLIAVVVNGLILPFIPVTMTLGILLVLAGLLSIKIGAIIGWLVWVLLKYQLIIIESLAKIPWASLTIKISSGWLGLGYYLLILAWLIRFYQIKRSAN